MKYKQLAEQYISAIQSGKLAALSRMPSLRQFSQLHRVSMTTTLNCYQHLESQGWIVAKPQSGYFVAKRGTHRQPALVQFESRMASVAEYQAAEEWGSHGQAPESQHAGPLGYSRFEADAVLAKQLEQSFRRAHQRLGERMNFYPAPQGEQITRTILSQHFAPYGFHFQPDQLVITHGCMDAIREAIEVCTQPGDAIAISSPCFNGLLTLLREMSRNIVEIPSVESGIDLDQLENHMQQGTIQAGLFCTTHMNPQGITMTPEQKQRLARMAAQYQVPVIEDDVYMELPYSNTVPLPAKYYDQAGYILWCGSVSKTLAASYRLGWCLPGRYFESYLRRFAAGCFGVSLPVQLAIADFIDNGQYSRSLKHRRFALLANKRRYIEYLEQALPGEVRISDPAGGMVLWLQIPALNLARFKHLLQATKLDIRLGALFTSRDLYRDCLRVNIGYALPEPGEPGNATQQALDALIQLLKQAMHTDAACAITETRNGDIAETISK
ncbi:PLP-dependent aminotransferase family protein [Photobacterium sp. 1_MG-2023]|uniref:aminotransferase-like domain-containing protein n=1 Tax=Photobacterium sp. 1_MG-2023 TaxID=3062646 RepID=UPI0026E40271|nr:PLP-dependent aminotransferase family protein [Photobacterium sp. 1_MG-2023]MDO6708179.1 PLP-dependent aminotransferase family protein [Photobacterium sp. 1_MG-2023]